MGLPGGPRNIFNALSGLSQGTELRLQILALSGGSAVSNAFTEEADRLGLTAKGRELKEREEQRRVTERMEAIREQAAKFQERLNLLEQASAEALMQNEEQLLFARENLRLVRERAYEITLPDGKVGKVYRDGDKVRTEDGAEVGPDTVRAEDIGSSHSSWQELEEARAHQKNLEAEREAIVAYQRDLGEVRNKGNRSGLSLDDLEALEASAETNMPSSVRERINASGIEAQKPTQQAVASARETNGLLIGPFTNAAVGSTAAPADDLTPPRPAAAAPAPR